MSISICVYVFEYVYVLISGGIIHACVCVCVCIYPHTCVYSVVQRTDKNCLCSSGTLQRLSHYLGLSWFVQQAFRIGLFLTLLLWDYRHDFFFYISSKNWTGVLAFVNSSILSTEPSHQSLTRSSRCCFTVWLRVGRDLHESAFQWGRGHWVTCGSRLSDLGSFTDTCSWKHVLIGGEACNHIEKQMALYLRR